MKYLNLARRSMNGSESGSWSGLSSTTQEGFKEFRKERKARKQGNDRDWKKIRKQIKMEYWGNLSPKFLF